MFSIFRVAILLLALVAFVSPCAPVDAHADLLRADPAPDALLAAPPRTLDLWLTEPVAEGDGSPSIRLLDQSGRERSITDLAVDPNDPTHVRATLAGVGTGTFTVVWSNRSATDGHTISGSYAFRVASSTRAPGAATTADDDPAAWAVATRWLTFFGAALIAGGFAIGHLVLATGGSDSSRRRRGLAILVGASAALLATIAEPVLQTTWPANGVTAPSFSEAVRTLPYAWWFRPAALLVSLLVAAISWRLAARWAIGPARPSPGSVRRRGSRRSSA